MGTQPKRRALWIAALAVVALASCVPVAPPPPPPPPPPPAPPASVPGCGSSAVPTEAAPIEYVAVVDAPGAAPPSVETFTATSEADKQAKVDKLVAKGKVVAVAPDTVVTAFAVTDDPRTSTQWGLTNSGFATAWAAGLDGTGVRIAVIDSGVHGTHEEMSANVVQGIDFYAGDETNPAGTSDFGRMDANGHGTHVAGIAAAADNGLGGLGGAPGATIVPVRILGPNGSGSDADLVAAIYWAADPAKGNADVINISLGGAACSSTEQAALDYAESQGVVVVASAGNSASNVPVYPAGFDGEVISVGATTSTNTKAAFSNWGTPFVDIGAPGLSIISSYKDTSGQPPNGAYSTLSGTSMSSPFVAAVAALVLQHCPAIANGAPNGSSRADKVLSVLQSTASPVIPGLGASLVQAGTATAAACPA